MPSLHHPFLVRHGWSDRLDERTRREAPYATLEAAPYRTSYITSLSATDLQKVIVARASFSCHQNHNWSMCRFNNT